MESDEQMEMQDDVRARVMKFLPRAMETAIGAHKFSSVQKDKDGAVMKKHQEACKAAAAHIELLMKLARKVADEDSGAAASKESAREDMAALLRRAQEELGGI